MNPRVDNITESGDILTFTLSGINLSLANAVRRVILSDIKQVVFKTYNNEENKANIQTNTTRFNNEILKQRLGCIPIHIRDLEIPLKNYLLEVDVENLTDTIMYVTTQDFKIKNVSTDTYLKEKDVREIFPANMQTGSFIDFVRLRPKISDEILGEKIQFSCEFSIGTAKENGMFNAASTCSYGNTLDDVKMNVELGKKKQQWKDQGLSKDEIEFEVDNWKLLDGKRITLKDSFDFTVQTVGIFTNQELLQKACDILINGLAAFDVLIETDDLKINASGNTMNNCYDIILENEDYTFGKILEYMMYNKFFEQGILTYCGFKKMHPHDSDSIIRVAYKDDADKTIIKGHLKSCIEDAVHIFKKIKKQV